ncbi:hypothetical protein MF271_13885 [Deinococcus sp. KNUC1210]|uniref:hypothetical protein n=1 Tax=Deinococcus sp. KNUC1210 TaxID=2917691 RepID=UPI001EF099E6|nr:hypothetical protein [Deinococcus sp. KNUC1210]ULH15038.1 hypothetical protein MF271_13885 [Deinococcus sp. KNUC1210]
MFMFFPTARRLLTLCSVGLASLWAAPALAAPVPDPPPDRAILSYPALRPVVSTSAPVTLLFSDSPETPSASGLLYRDTVTGRARVLAYHANGLSTPARVRLLARNTGTQALQVNPLRQGSATVSGPDPLVGQQTLLRYFASGPRPGRTLQPGERAALYDSGPLLPDSVVSLLLDLETSGPLELSVVIVGEEEQPGSLQLDSLPTLAPDRFHQRGTFTAAQRTLGFVLPASAAPVRLVLGGSDDPPLQGRDMLTGAAQQLKGNFGLLYDIRLEGAAGRLLAASPRGGLYQGTLLLQDGEARSQVLLGQGQALLDPAAPTFLWQLRAPQQHLLFMPANGSNMPLALLFYPRSANRPPRGK